LIASLAAYLGTYGCVGATPDDRGGQGSFWSAVVVCQPVTKSLEIVRMRPRPGVEWRDIVERRWRNGVEVLRGEVGGLYIDVDIMWDVVGRVGWIVMFVEAR
jgi:hypothetical protein